MTAASATSANARRTRSPGRSFTTTERARATLTRRGVVYAATIHLHQRQRLVLYVRRRLAPGSYTLSLTAAHRRIAVRTIVLR
jgi:hypothetical protein